VSLPSLNLHHHLPAAFFLKANPSFILVCSILDMSHPSLSSQFQSPFDAALWDYQGKTGTSLVDHPLAKELEKCDSVDSISIVLQGQARAVCQHQGDEAMIMKSIKCIVQDLQPLSNSAVLGEGTGKPFPPAKVVFAGIGILLSSIKDASAGYDRLLDLLGSFESFLSRLDINSRISPDGVTAVRDVLVKRMVEFLSTLALETKQVKQG